MVAERVDRFVLRLPDGLRQTLKRLAKKNRRSLNAEIVARMERSLAGLHSRDLDDEKRQVLIREFFGVQDPQEKASCGSDPADTGGL